MVTGEKDGRIYYNQISSRRIYKEDPYVEYLDYASCNNDGHPMVWSCQFWYKVETE